jgi:hypothetical protein
LRIEAQGGGRAYIRVSPFVPPDNSFFGRLYIWVTEFPSAPDFAHFTLVEAAAATAGLIRPIGGQYIPEPTAGESLWGVGSDGGATGDWTNWRVTTPTEAGRWICLDAICTLHRLCSLQGLEPARSLVRGALESCTFFGEAAFDVSLFGGLDLLVLSASVCAFLSRAYAAHKSRASVTYEDVKRGLRQLDAGLTPAATGSRVRARPPHPVFRRYSATLTERALFFLTAPDDMVDRVEFM